MRTVPVVMIALLAVMLTAGCISSIASTEGYTNDYVNGLATRLPMADSADAVKCKDANCVCMVCKKGQSFFSFLGLTSFAGGSCYFLGLGDATNQCTSDQFSKLTAGTSPLGKDLAVNYFRIGQGPSFADFGNADPYCNNRLGMAVQWLIGAPGSPYALPSPRRAVCMLDKGVMPVYVLYSGGQDINIDQTTRIANILGTGGASVTGGRLPGPVGPVVVTTEMNYDASQAEQIKAQVRAINAGCGNDRTKNPPDVHCLVAVAPKLGDYAALNAVLPLPTDPAYDPEFAKQVDLVAYGIDSDSMNLKGYCNQPSLAWENATVFSRYTLYNLSKPSIIPYVIFDAEGSDASGSCSWNEQTMTEGYKAFFESYVQTLPALGVMGVAPYLYKSSGLAATNPLGCKSCGVGDNAQRLRAWYGGCQAYVSLSRQVSTGVSNYPSYGALLRFPDQPSGSCQDDSNDIASKLTNLQYTDNNFLTPQLPPAPQPATASPIFSCDACVSDKTGPAPFSFPAKTALPAACTSYPDLDYFAGQRSLDPMFVRAIAASESSFNPCAVAAVKSGQECYAQAYTSMTDPSGCTISAPSGSRFCGLGLMQSLEPPYDYWPAEYRREGNDGRNVAIYEDAVNRGLAADLDLARGCNPTSFNPFNPTDSACVGTAKLAQKMQIAQAKVNTYHAEKLLNWQPADVEKDNVFAAYIAANLYVGDWKDSWMDDFYLQGLSVTASSCDKTPVPAGCSGRGQPDTSNCYGLTDPVQFIGCKINHNAAGYPSSAVGDRGAQKMGYYYYMRDHCTNSQCPDWKALYNADAAAQRAVGGTEPPLPSSGDALIPDKPKSG